MQEQFTNGYEPMLVLLSELGRPNLALVVGPCLSFLCCGCYVPAIAFLIAVNRFSG